MRIEDVVRGPGDQGVESITVRDGLLVRTSPFRRNVGGKAAAYAQSVARGEISTSCAFCPPKINEQDLIKGAPHGFNLFRASAPYDWWDAQKVEEHFLITPEEHVTSLQELGKKALHRLYVFVRDLQNNADPEMIIQEYTRVPGNPSKSVEHLHTHLFHITEEPVGQLDYNTQDGLTKLKFIRPTDEQIAALRQARNRK